MRMPAEDFTTRCDTVEDLGTRPGTRAPAHAR